MNAEKSRVQNSLLREQLLYLLEGRGAHISFQAAVKGFPVNLLGKRIPLLAHTAWQLVDHIRVVQWDILEFILNPKHVSPEYPGGYWSKSDAPPDVKDWKRTMALIQEDLDRMKTLVKDPKSDLFAPIPHGSGQTLLREALLVADHNSYHIGQLVDLRMLLGAPVRDY